MIIDPSTNQPVPRPTPTPRVVMKECPRCQGPKEKFEVYPPGFGGYFKTVCPCGEVIEEGRKTL